MASRRSRATSQAGCPPSPPPITRTPGPLFVLHRWTAAALAAHQAQRPPRRTGAPPSTGAGRGRTWRRAHRRHRRVAVHGGVDRGRVRQMMGAAGAIVRPVLDRSVPAVLPHALVEALLLETALAQAVDEPTAPRRALQAALTAPEPLDALRPFIQAKPGRSGSPARDCSRSDGDSESSLNDPRRLGRPNVQPSHRRWPRLLVCARLSGSGGRDRTSAVSSAEHVALDLVARFVADRDQAPWGTTWPNRQPRSAGPNDLSSCIGPGRPVPAIWPPCARGPPLAGAARPARGRRDTTWCWP